MKKPDEHTVSAEPSCPFSPDVVAWLQDEMASDRKSEFERHLPACAACRAEAEANRAILQRLRSIGVRTVSRDLSDEILGKIPPEAWFTARVHREWEPRVLHLHPFVLWATAAAACLAIAAAGWTLYQRVFAERAAAKPPETLAGRTPPAPEKEPCPYATEAEQAVAWLCRTQEGNGSWDAAKWGAKKQFEPAVTALGLLAMLGDEENGPNPARDAARKAAIRYLLDQQNEAGHIGPVFDAAPYNHGIATVALLKAYEHGRNPALKTALDRALAAIVGRQTPEGGWGYMQTSDTTPNLPLSAWQIQALRLAESLGWSEARAAVRRGLAWVESTRDADGFFGYRQARDFPEGSPTLTAMGSLVFLTDPVACASLSETGRSTLGKRLEQAVADRGQKMDYYRWYFLTAALKQVRRDSAEQLASRLQKEIVERQVRTGPDTGSWSMDDRWTSAGGRVYATAMAAMSLQGRL